MAEHDEAMDRLRTSDPATGSHPDLHALRALVAQKAPASQCSDEVTRLHDDPLRGPRTMGPWIAAAAVAAIGLGGGGYALGAQQAEPLPVAGGTTVDPASSGDADADSGSGADGGTERMLLDSAPDSAQPGLAADSGMDGGMGDDAMAMEGGDAMAMEGGAGMAYDLGPVRLTAGEGLPAGPGTGEVLALSSDKDPQELVDQLVAGLGMDASPMPEGDAWRSYASGAIDPVSGEVIQAGIEGGPLTFHYESVYTSEWCSTMFEGIEEEDLAIVREDWVMTYGPDMPLPDADSCRTPTGPAPSEEAAKAAGAGFFALLGIDTSGYTVEAWVDDYSSSVSIDYWPEGMEYGQLSLNVMVGPDGVTSAYGTIGELVSLGEYPVISASEAVERYGTREWGMDYHVSIPEDYQPYTEEAMTDELSMPVEDYPEPVTLTPGDRIPLLLKDKTVTGAELVQGTLDTSAAGSVEVPVWKLLTDDGLYYSVLALADEALDFQSWE